MTWMIGLGLFAAIWIGSIWLGGFVAREKDRDPMTGYLMGLFFGLIGVLILALLPPGQPRAATRREVESSEDEPDWKALGIVQPKGVEPLPPKAFTLPPAKFRGLRDDQADSL